MCVWCNKNNINHINHDNNNNILNQWSCPMPYERVKETWKRWKDWRISW